MVESGRTFNRWNRRITGGRRDWMGSDTLNSPNRQRPQLNQSGNVNVALSLHHAAEHGKAKILEFILSNDRCDISRSTKDGSTALHYAVSKWGPDVKSDTERMTCIQLLVSHNISVNAKRRSTGDTAGHIVMREVMKRGPISETVVRTVLNATNLNNRLDKLAQACRPHWQLATMCFLCLKGADLNVQNKEGETVLSMWDNPDIHNICREMAKNRGRGCIQMTSLKDSVIFDCSLLAMCTFNCDNSAANVRFVPCGHRSICSVCVKAGCFIPYQCTTCQLKILRLKSDEGESWDCDNLRETSLAAIAERKKSEDVEEADGKGNAANDGPPLDGKEPTEEEIAQREKLEAELQELEAELEELEEQLTCPICMDELNNVIFGCGHTCCSGCGGKKMLKDLCPICQQPITQKYNFIVGGGEKKKD
ncbi:hypothetical protein QR680_004531 [Steinernema hermaphroditum]|uniref:RING-type domain-containing protein n=1 Tax=Steinernema hermaphroditum TaxID=289476 RepID=A0AA39HP01_9BILA|nr:hypothetical protein QR680_004531 [Steinernema hermaphroditum]